ncbi:uncharacterized protein LOC144745994 [Ciona intestinalis]
MAFANRRDRDCSHEVCCKLTVIYVTGHGFSSSRSLAKYRPYDEVDKQFINWFRIPSEQFKRIDNDSPLFSALKTFTALTISALPVSKEVVSEIHNEVETAVKKCGCNGINTIVLAHSHGAKCVQQAFRSFTGNPGEMRNLYNKVSILTFGATCLIDKQMVKVTRNFFFVNDNVFNMCHWQRISEERYNMVQLGPFEKENEIKFACLCCRVAQPLSDNTEVNVEVNLGGGTNVRSMINLYDAGLAPISYHRASAVDPVQQDPQQPQGQGGYFGGFKPIAHYAKEYIECKMMKRNIEDTFKLIQSSG